MQSREVEQGTEQKVEQGIDRVINQLKNYDGNLVTLMEVCGSHTAAIAKNGIPSIISEKIRLVSGPGCPVCVTPTAYIDRLIELAKKPDSCVVTFGDLLRVPGSRESLNEAKSEGAKVHMVYSPMDTIKLAKEHPEIHYIFAAVGFETTTPIYALLIEQLLAQHVENVQILTALKTMPEAIDWLMSHGAKVDGFLAPGHVCAVTGSDAFAPVASRYQEPMAVAGFQAEELLVAIYGLVYQVEKLRKDKLHTDMHIVKEQDAKRSAEIYDENRGAEWVLNYYPSVVTSEGNLMAQEKVDTYFEKCDATWRGMGNIPNSGKVLKPEYLRFDAGSRNLTEDHKKNQGCCCDQVLMGKIEPQNCPLFGKACTPQNPQGACMVSAEGSCATRYSIS